MRDPDEWGLKDPRSLYWPNTREGHRMFHAARRRWNDLGPALIGFGRLYKCAMMLDRILSGGSRMCKICRHEYAVALGDLRHCNGCVAIVASEFRDELAQGTAPRVVSHVTAPTRREVVVVRAVGSLPWSPPGSFGLTAARVAEAHAQAQAQARAPQGAPELSDGDILAYVVERLERTSRKVCGSLIWHPKRVRRRHRACIYSIQCSALGIAYVGRTIDRTRRWKQHRKELREGKHHNWRLQRAHDAHDGQSLTYSVVQDCAGAGDEVLHEAELAHIQAAIARDGRVFNVRLD